MIKRKDGLWQERISLPGMAKPKYFYAKTHDGMRDKCPTMEQRRIGPP